MTLITFLLATWFVGMCLAAYLFCNAAREFVSILETEPLTLKSAVNGIGLR